MVGTKLSVPFVCILSHSQRIVTQHTLMLTVYLIELASNNLLRQYIAVCVA